MEKPLNFERFTSTGGRFNYTISLNRSGGFSFNSGFYKKHELKNFSYVILFFDRKINAVAFSFVKKQAKESLKISHTKNATAYVRSNSFVSAYEIKPKIFAGQYRPREHRTEEGEKLFYILLEEKKK